MVREAGLEPARPQWTLEPESSESANSTTRAYFVLPLALRLRNAWCLSIITPPVVNVNIFFYFFLKNQFFRFQTVDMDFPHGA